MLSVNPELTPHPQPPTPTPTPTPTPPWLGFTAPTGPMLTMFVACMHVELALEGVIQLIKYNISVAAKFDSRCAKFW